MIIKMKKILAQHKIPFSLLIFLSILSCQPQTKLIHEDKHSELKRANQSFYGTTLPFASEAVYFLMTDRFVDGDSTNNQVDQGGKYPTFQQPIISKEGKKAYVGYMGGDFKGILDNADYISEMGFTSIWITPIVDQPDQAFAGGEPIEFGGAFKDGGKTGYHGYWGSNFFKIDEHLPSKDLSFKQLTESLRNNYGIKTILDIVLNHGSPAFSMPINQEKFGQIFDSSGKLIADHQNVEPKDLDENNPLHRFYNKKTEIVQLSDINENNPEVLDYFTSAYLHWIDQGADAFRLDTLKHMPHAFWKKFSDNIREKHPDFFMFGESYSFDAKFLAEHTQPENGGISVLDFVGKQSITKVFEDPNSDFSDIKSYLYLQHSPYQSPYELMTFYDNHDMARMNATSNGFIDANNWLFTSRGIPVIYYGSEIAFMAGTSEHAGNRNYFGVENIAKAKADPIYLSLSKIANLRKNSIALQKGLQVNLEFKNNKAAFYRIYEHDGVHQTALVLLNKGDNTAAFEIKKYLSEGTWQEAFSEQKIKINAGSQLQTDVEAHQVKVYLLNHSNQNSALRKKLTELMNSKG